MPGRPGRSGVANVLFGPGGQAMATFLHTVGAIGYLAGIAFFIGWRRSLHRSHHNPSVLATGAALTYVSIAANLLGGFIRTYAPGHPGLYDLFDEPWVMLMTIKHLALFAGIGAAVYLFEIIAPRLKKRFDDGGLDDASQRSGRWATRTVVLSIVLAGVLGGVTTVIPIGEEADEDGGSAGTAPPEPFTGTTLSFDGSATSGSPDSGTFHVAEGATRLEAVLTGGDVGGALPIPFQMTLTITDPIGAQQSDTTPQTGERTASVAVDGPLAGPWTYQITTDAGAEAPWSLAIDIAGQEVLEGEVTIAAGEAFEIEVDAQEGGQLHWDWSADAALDWSIHSHSDHGVEMLEQGRTDSDSGTLTAQHAGDHGLLWEAAEETVLTYRVWGDFEADG